MAGERCTVSARSHGAQGSQREASRKGLVPRCVQQVQSGTVKGDLIMLENALSHDTAIVQRGAWAGLYTLGTCLGSSRISRTPSFQAPQACDQSSKQAVNCEWQKRSLCIWKTILISYMQVTFEDRLPVAYQKVLKQAAADGQGLG